MPRYDFRCDDGHVHEHVLRMNDTKDLNLPCPTCFKPSKWTPTAQFQPEFRPFWHEHMAASPVYIESRRDYERKCREHGVYGPYSDRDRGRNRSEV